MYSDPSQIRKHKVTLYLNDAEADLTESIHNYIGGEKAPLMRDMLLVAINRVLAGDTALIPNQNEESQMQLFKVA